MTPGSRTGPPTAERVREMLAYSPSDGVFRWRVAGRGRPYKVGDVAGTAHNRGYRAICVDGKKYLAHRLAWLYVHGEWPGSDIDHINGDRRDNRAANLRVVSRQVNLQNQRGTTLGTSYHRRDQKWAAQIQVGNKKTFLGYFNTAEEARARYVHAKRALHPGCTI